MPTSTGTCSRRGLRLHRLFGSALLLGSILAACGTSSAAALKSPGSANASVKSQSPYYIHAILSITGAGSILGSREAKALNVLAAQVNNNGGIQGHPLKFEIEDNRTSPTVAVSLATPIISSGTPLLFVGSIVAPDQAVDALTGPSGPFIYDFSPIENPKPGSMVFAAGTPLLMDAEAYLTFLKSKAYDNLSIITSTDATGVGGYQALREALKLPQFSSMHVVAHQTFNPSAVSANTQLSIIKAANPQALIIWTTGSPLGTVLNGMSELAMDGIPTVTDNGNASQALLKNFQSVLPKHTYFPTPPFYLPPAEISNREVRAKVTSFDNAITSIGGHPGNPYALAWDPAQLVLNALQKLGVGATPGQIQNYMQNLHNVPGVFGLYNTSRLHHHGLSTSDIYMTTWNGTSFVQASGPGGTAISIPQG